MNGDFENLINNPISDGYFSFKSEKNWTQHGTSRYNELFSIDVKKLSMLYNCIPFNQYIEVEDQYFTNDQLTLLTSTAEHAKSAYEMELLQEKNLAPSGNIGKQTCEGAIEEDLDFLLSLKEPLSLPGNIPVTTVKFETTEPKMTSHSNKSKSIDLETWLDSVLDE